MKRTCLLGLLPLIACSSDLSRGRAGELVEATLSQALTVTVTPTEGCGAARDVAGGRYGHIRRFVFSFENGHLREPYGHGLIDIDLEFLDGGSDELPTTCQPEQAATPRRGPTELVRYAATVSQKALDEGIPPEGGDFETHLAELVSLTGLLLVDDRTVVAEYEWNYATTDLGRALELDASENGQGVATLQLYDDGWRVTDGRVTARPPDATRVNKAPVDTIYFLEGHGEKDIRSGGDGYSSISGAVAEDDFRVDSLVIAEQNAVPDDATIVVVAGPQTDLPQNEVEALAAYLDGGGRLLVLVDPPVDRETPAPDRLIALLREWDIEPGNNVVVDASGLGQSIALDASAPVAATYPSHPITDRFELLTAYPLAQAVNPAGQNISNRVARSFIETSTRSWAEADLDELASGEVTLDEEAGDRRGPVTIGMAVSTPAPSADGANATSVETRLVVIGDSDFVTNNVVGTQGNRDMFLNIINWLAQPAQR